MNLPFIPQRFVVAMQHCDSPEYEVLQLSVSSEAPTHLNSHGSEKLRGDEWLISAILREINHLERLGEAERKTLSNAQLAIGWATRRVVEGI